MISVKSKTKKILLFSSIAAFLCAIAAVIFIVVNRKTSEDKSDANKKFDENNIGEVYCAGIEENHIAGSDNGISYIDNEILIVAADGVSKSDIEQLAKDIDAQIVGFIEQTGDYQLHFSKAMSESEFDNVIGDLKKNDKIISADKNFVFTVSTQSVDYDVDPGKEWNIYEKNVSVAEAVAQKIKTWGVTAIRAPQAWTAMNLIKDKINPVNVGLIDSGFFNHNDLGFAEMFYENYNNRVNVSDKTHGAHVAGTMAAKGNNKEGICGVYPYADGKLYGASWEGASQYKMASIMSEKCCFSELIFRNVKVINCSYGFNLSTYYDDESSLIFLTNESKILGDFLNRTLKNGYDFLIVSAAGNESDDIVVKLKSQKDNNGKTYPIINNNTVEFDEKGSPTIVEKENGKLYYQKSKNEKYEVIGIKDYDKQTFIANRDYRDGHLESKYASFLNAIPNEKEYEKVYNRIIVVGSVGNKISDFSNAGERIDIFAPGEKIYSTIPKNKYGYSQGTSMAAPHVAGVCANIWSIDNSLCGEEVKKIVCNAWVDNKSVYKTPDTKQDRGVVDCLKAVEKAFDGAKNKDSTIAKNVSNGAVLGWVYETDGKTPIEGAKVTAQNGEQVYTVTTDKYGHFELIVPGGKYTIVVSKGNEYNEWRSKEPVTVINGGVYYYNDGESETIKLAKTVKKDSNKDKPLENAITPKYLDEISIIESDQYNDNEGDSFVYPIGKHKFSRGRTDISGKEYKHGIEVWIARWNYTEEKSWAYSVFKLNKEYRNISGKCVLINSYNTNNFNTTLEFYGDGKLIKKYSLTPDSVPFDIDVDVNNIDELKIYAYDNIAVSGGTSFGLTEMKLKSSSKVDSDHIYEIIESANITSFDEAEKYCETLGGHLATISSKEENDKIFKLMQSKGYQSAYFGFTDRDEEGNWKWINGETSSYTNWHSGEPNNENGDEDYAMFYYKFSDGTWNDGDFGKQTDNGGMAFICEWDDDSGIKEATDEQLYKEILDQYTEHEQHYGLFGEQIKSNEIGYAFYDLNDDGIKELLIIISYGKKNSGAISELYSIVDNKPKLLLSKTFVGSSISIAQDNSIVLYNRFSAFSCWYDKYNSLNTLLSSEKPEEIIDHDIYSETSPYTYSIGGNKKTISGSEFQSIVNKWTNNSKTFNIKLFSEYK